GTALGGGAHLRNLRRIAIGTFTVDDAATIDAIGDASLLPAVSAVRGYRKVVGSAALIGSGKVLARSHLGVDDSDGPWAVVDDAGELLAMYEPYQQGMVKPAVVLSGG